MDTLFFLFYVKRHHPWAHFFSVVCCLVLPLPCLLLPACLSGDSRYKELWSFCSRIVRAFCVRSTVSLRTGTAVDLFFFCALFCFSSIADRFLACFVVTYYVLRRLHGSERTGEHHTYHTWTAVHVSFCACVASIGTLCSLFCDGGLDFRENKESYE